MIIVGYAEDMKENCMLMSKLFDKGSVALNKGEQATLYFTDYVQ